MPLILGLESTCDETAAALVRCATEAWLWRAGRGRPYSADRSHCSTLATARAPSRGTRAT